MIVLNVFYKFKPGKRAAFMKVINDEGLAEASRAEDGNSKYDYYFAENSEDEMVLVEHWRDAESLEIHGKQPHFLRMGELRPEFLEEVQIDKFEK